MVNDSPRRCAVYLRISLDSTGEGLAVERQREDCLSIAQERGWEVTGEYVDNGISASDRSKTRPAYNHLVEDFVAGKFEALICYDLDRLTRQPRQLEDWIDAAEDRGLVLVTANGEADLSTDAGRLFARIKASVAKSEVERKAARQRRAAAQRVAKGRVPAGVRLTGYDSQGHLIPHEAKLVEEMFDRFLRGDSLRAIAANLTERGERTRRGGSWNSSSVRTILLNPRYAGLASLGGKAIRVDGERVQGEWPAIVSEATFDNALAILTSPARKHGVGTDRRHLGSGLFLCGECDRAVRSHNARYRCPEGHLMRSMPQIDAAVIAVVRARLARPDARDLLATTSDDEGQSHASAVANLSRRLAAIDEDYDSGRIDGHRYASARARVERELAARARTFASRTAGNALSATLTTPDPVTAFDSGSLGVRRSVIAALMEVRLLRAPRGRKGFDPKTLLITWTEVPAAAPQP